MKKLILLSLFLWLISVPHALPQELPPLFKTTPRSIVHHSVIAEFPKQTFLENLVVLNDGSLLVNSHYEGTVYQVNDGKQPIRFANVEGKVTGIAAYGKDKFIITGNDNEDNPTIFLLNSEGEISKQVNPEGAEFLNGITHWKGNLFLIADSYRGCIWLFDAKNGKTSIWLQNELLARSDSKNPTPAANGIKIFDKKVFVSNTQRQLLLTIPIKNDLPSEPEVYLDNVNVDDFFLDPTGTIYASTHVFNSVLRINPDKSVVVIAELEQGVAGSTACIISQENNERFLIISTNGGMYYPPATGIEPSKIVKLNLN